MSRVTRCPKCETLFKVVPDQLRLSQGWVRCGNCSAVFDASEQMQHAQAHDSASGDVTGLSLPVWSLLLDNSAGSPMPAASRPPTSNKKSKKYASDTSKNSAENTPYSDLGGVTSTIILTESSFRTDSPEPEAWHSNWSRVAQGIGPNEPSLLLDQVEFVNPNGSIAPEALLAAKGETGLTNTEANPESIDTDSLGAHAHSETGPLLVDAALASDAKTTEADAHPLPQKASHEVAGQNNAAHRAPAPSPSKKSKRLKASNKPESTPEPVPVESKPEDNLSFVKEAKRRQFWRKPLVRTFLFMAFAGIFLGLSARWVHDQRDWLAAAYPEAKPWLEQACASLNCQIKPYKHLESIAIQHSEFNRLPTGNFQLSLSIRNLDKLTVGMPSLTLTLTDASDQVVKQQILNPAQLQAPNQLLAQRDWSGSLIISLDNTPDIDLISGYRLHAFYP